MPYIKPTNRKFCINSDIADRLLMRQEEFPCEPYDEPYYNPVDKKHQTKIEILHNFWLGCEDQPGCGDGQRETSYPYEAFLGVDKYYLENVFKYPVNPNDLPYDEPQFAYQDLQWVQYKDIFGVQYHFTINDKLSDSWTTHYYKQTNKNALPTSDLNKNFVVTSFKKRLIGTYTDDYNTAKANAPAGCDHYNQYVDQYPLIFHHGIKPYNLMYQAATSWVQDSFTTTDPVFHATATPQNYVIPTTENSTQYDTDITFSLPEYSGLTFVEYVWNIRQVESGLTLKATIRQNKKTGTVHFNDGNTIRLKGIGSYGSRGVIPSKGITYTGDYVDGVNDTISWYNRTNGLSPSTGNFTDEDHADSTGLNDNITITSDQSWCHNIRYNITGWTAYVDWWKDGEGKGSRTANIVMTNKDPRLDVVEPDSFQIIQDAPVPKPCYHFSGLSANNLSCHGGSVNATVQESIKKIYHDYSPCADGVSEEYYVRTEQVGWTYSPTSIGMNTDCYTKTHTITATQNESGLKLTTTITQSYDCDHQDYINNCYASPSSVGSGGGTVTIHANARYYDKTCVVNYDNSSYSPTTYSIPANTTQSSKSYQIPVYNAGTAMCYVTVTQDGQPAPAGCNNNEGYSISASISSTSVSCDGGSVTVTVDTARNDNTSSDVSWTVNPGNHTGTGSGTATVTIDATDSDKTTTVTLTSDAGNCSWDVTQSDCGGGGGDTGGTDPSVGKCGWALHTPSSYHDMPYTGQTFTTYIISSYYDEDGNCSPESWTAETNCDWLHLEIQGASGYCCDAFDPDRDMSKHECTGSTTAKLITRVDENPYNVARECTVTLRQTGTHCSRSSTFTNSQVANPNGSGGGGSGDCSCCKCHVHTDYSLSKIPCTGQTIPFYVVYSCDDCVPKDWEIYCRDNGGQWPDWVHWSKTTGAGRCNDDIYDCNYQNAKEVIDAGKAESLTCTFDCNSTGAQRSCNWGYRLKNNGSETCGFEETFTQLSGCTCGGEAGCTDCYVLFKNARTVNAEASGLTLTDEGIVQHGTGNNCKCCVDNFTIDPDNIGVKVNPSNGCIDACTITVPENTSTQQRTIKITIHPHDGEKSDANCD